MYGGKSTIKGGILPYGKLHMYWGGVYHKGGGSTNIKIFPESGKPNKWVQLTSHLYNVIVVIRDERNQGQWGEQNFSQVRLSWNESIIHILPLFLLASRVSISFFAKFQKIMNKLQRRSGGNFLKIFAIFHNNLCFSSKRAKS